MNENCNELKVALITGANSGIGYALALRLLEHDSRMHICLGCRNKVKAKAAQNSLLIKYPSASISVLLIDVAKPASVYQAAAYIKQRFRHVDYVFLNAGIMPGTTVDWGSFRSQLFSSRCVHMFATGDGLLKQTDETTSDGLKQIFATNVFGHFLLVSELKSLARGPDGPMQIIWTSSSNAKKDAFQLDDIQHAQGTEPYSASKYASDLVSYAFNVHLNDKLRLFTANITITPEVGCESLFWLSQQRPETLNPCAKYHSQVSFTGSVYVSQTKMSIDHELAMQTYDKLADMAKSFQPHESSGRL